MTKTRRQRAAPPSQRPPERYDSQRARVQEALDEHWFYQDSLSANGGSKRDAPTIRQLADKYEIKKSTLGQLIHDKKRQVSTSKPGRSLALSRTLECMLAVWILAQQATGYSLD